MLVDKLHTHAALQAFAQAVEAIKAVKQQRVAPDGHKAAAALMHWNAVLHEMLHL